MMKLISLSIFSTLLLLAVNVSAQEFGKASYIDPAYQGGKTASGEPYDGNQFTAAHKIHPFNTRLRVSRLDNEKSVIVRVNDRGPHIKGRIIDLSYAAAKSLDMIREGTIDVKIEVVSEGTASRGNNSSPRTTTTTPLTTTPPPTNPNRNLNPGASNNNSGTSPNSTNPTTIIPPVDNNASSFNANNNARTEKKNTPPVTKNNTTDYADRLLKQEYKKFGLYEIKILTVNKAGYGVQVAALSSYENAMKQLTRMQAKNITNALLSVEPRTSGGSVFKVIVGPYASKDEAKRQVARMKRLFRGSPYVVDLSTLTY